MYADPALTRHQNRKHQQSERQRSNMRHPALIECSSLINMRLPKLLETLTRTPLLMTPASVESILTLFQQHALLSGPDFKAAREGKDFCGDKVELDQMVIEDSLAIIPVKGPLGIGLDAFEKGAGATDYVDIMSDTESARSEERRVGKECRSR